ncbi:radical SAM superfamily protein [Clostridium baratii str. Sullivan]|uniref:Radical SAM superfamily protein n=1 Tax=Clostridium baratii str. Sullivan TaxID=1415775 RepID=A0A0A7FSU8_9CLOT|nr:radical SAM protein [Clostridium baratii]AIY82699.1 radical SAM superfamily protein [Clostridium baratii str. Sullivan]
MKRFKKVYIEITNVCNLSCNFCPKTKRKLQSMDEESFKKVIESIKPYTDYIYLHLMGEPFLNKNLKKFLDIAYENGLKVNITTNGTLINKVKDILINAKALRQVNISLHSFEANDSEVKLEEYVSNICDFILDANENSNIICSMRLWNMDSKELKACNELNRDIISMLEEGLKIPFSLKAKLLESNGVKIRKNIYLNMAEKFEWPNIDKDNEDTEIFCYGLRDQMGILVDGTVVPCCLDSEGNINLGNIFENSLGEILESDRAQNIYDGFSRRCAVEDLCKRCGYAKRYKK